MSIKIELNKLTDETRVKISKDLNIKLPVDKFNKFAKAKYINPFEVDGNDLYIPYSYGVNELELQPPNKNSFSKREIKFEGKLRELQVEVKKTALNHLNERGTTLIALYPGAGKTITSIYIASKTKLRTLIIIHRLVIMDQWEKSIKKVCPTATVQQITTSSVKQDCDFYIMNAMNVPKFEHSFFKDIGTLIVDESHNILAELMSKSLTCIAPRYLIGLTATPYRTDGLNVLFDLYYGKEKIVKELWREHFLYKIDTGFEPEIEMGANGKVVWGKVIDSQANDEKRNELIIRLIKKFKDRCFLVLCKRVSQAKYIFKRLKEEGESATSLIGNQQEFDREARILIGTAQKVSVGFDHPKLNTLLLACDIVDYYLQVLGRVMRTEEGKPVIFDLVDDYSILKRHFSERKKICIKHGGVFRNFKKDCPDFKI